LPRADIIRIDSDVKGKSVPIRDNLPRFKEAGPWLKSNVLITTKLGIRDIDYSQLGLFGIISADTGLFMPDFRAQEKTFHELSHILSQCHTSKDCKVIIQTYHPDNHGIYLAVQQNYLKFYEQEINLRKKLEYPPFTRLATISITSAKAESAIKTAEKIAKKLSSIKDITVLGPSLAERPKKIRMHTYQILIKMKPNQSLSNLFTRKDLMLEDKNIDINIDPL
ncbi:MAG: hypothetical protein L0Y76_07960, partial [Ignavibacteria bacterium]|nr:hypothetical protein [Ignavibacteria bacterium]